MNDQNEIYELDAETMAGLERAAIEDDKIEKEIRATENEELRAENERLRAAGRKDRALLKKAAEALRAARYMGGSPHAPSCECEVWPDFDPDGKCSCWFRAGAEVEDEIAERI